MRHVGDTLAWLAMILVVTAVLYFTPRLANYVAAATTTEHGVSCDTCAAVACQHEDSFESSP
jgi:hypothetical protein